MSKSKTNNDLICNSCTKKMIVKEMSRETKTENNYSFCLYDRQIDCNTVTECNKWTAIK